MNKLKKMKSAKNRKGAVTITTTIKEVKYKNKALDKIKEIQINMVR